MKESRALSMPVSIAMKSHGLAPCSCTILLLLCQQIDTWTDRHGQMSIVIMTSRGIASSDLVRRMCPRPDTPRIGMAHTPLGHDQVLEYVLWHGPWRWKRRGHWGGCGQSCGCCRSHTNEDAQPEANCICCYEGWVLSTVSKAIKKAANRCAQNNECAQHTEPALYDIQLT